MTATLPNRVAEFFPAATIETPTTPEGRREAWADAVFAAVAFLRSRLESHDAKAAERAAFALIDLEKTRLRHGRDLPSTPPEPKPPRDHGLPPLPDYQHPNPMVLSEEFEEEEEFEDDELDDEDSPRSLALAAEKEDDARRVLIDRAHDRLERLQQLDPQRPITVAMLKQFVEQAQEKGEAAAKSAADVERLKAQGIAFPW